MSTLIEVFTESGLILDIAFIIGVVVLLHVMLKEDDE